MDSSTTSRPISTLVATGLLHEETPAVASESVPGVNRERSLSVLVAPCSKRWGPLEDRFWRKVEKTPACWLWTGARFTGPRGERTYGAFRVDGKTKKAHVVAWMLTNGSISNSARLIRHLCNNPRCVRPDHLAEGGAGDNYADMIRAGRGNFTGVKLSPVRRAALRVRILAGESLLALAKEFGISRQSLHRQRTNLLKAGAA